MASISSGLQSAHVAKSQLATELGLSWAGIIKLEEQIKKAEYIPEMFLLPNMGIHDGGSSGWDGATLRIKDVELFEPLSTALKTYCNTEVKEGRTYPFGQDAQIMDLEIKDPKRFVQDFASIIKFRSGVKELLSDWAWARKHSSDLEIPEEAIDNGDISIRLDPSSLANAKGAIELSYDLSEKGVSSILEAAGIINYILEESPTSLSAIPSEEGKPSNAAKFLAAYAHAFYKEQVAIELDNLSAILEQNKRVCRA